MNAPLTFTLYPYAGAEAEKGRTINACELRALLESPAAAPDTHAGKLNQPLLFSGPLHGNVRKDHAPEHLSALIVEHDAGASASNPRHMAFEEARARLVAAGLRAWLFTTWSHDAKGGPRWRVILPMCTPAPTSCLVEYAEAVNHLLDGVLARESTQAKRGWFIGARAGRERLFSALEGEALDTAALFNDMPRRPLPEMAGAGGRVHGQGLTPEAAASRQAAADAADSTTVVHLRDAAMHLAQQGVGIERDDWFTVGQAIKSLALLRPELDEELCAVWQDYSASAGDRKGSASGTLWARAADQWADLPADCTSHRVVFVLAAARGWINPLATAPTSADGFEDAPDAPIDRSSREGYFYYAPTGLFIDRITREMWPAKSVDASVKHWETRKVRSADGGEKEVRTQPSKWLEKNRAVHQLSWLPGSGEVAEGIAIMEAGQVPSPGNRVFNLYRPPATIDGDAGQAGKWLDHLRAIYPDDADHLCKWMAYHIQQPAGKCNHALVLIGAPGIGKDTMLEPLVHGVGPWNFADTKPGQLVGQFNGYRRNKIIRVNEAHDTGDEITRHGMHEAAKVLIAAPPEVLMVNEKHRREYAIPNKCGVVFTSNHPTDAMYLPADDRRHYVAASKANKEMFSGGYWTDLWAWYEAGGLGHAVAYLQGLDLASFNPKAPPPLTPAFWTLVSSGEAPEDGDLRDLIAAVGSPVVMTLDDLIDKADHRMFEELHSNAKRRQWQHRLGRAGYLPVRNPGTTDGRWKIDGRNRTVYGQQGATYAQHCAAIAAMAERVREVRGSTHQIF